MSPAAIALCILVPLFLFTLVFVAWVYQEPDNPEPSGAERRESMLDEYASGKDRRCNLSKADMREALQELDEMGIRFGNPDDLRAKDRGSFK